MLPQIVIHNEISLDGRIDWMSDDNGLYYETIGRFQVDAMLSGSNTILDALPDFQSNPGSPTIFPAAMNFEDPRQLLVVVDSRGRIRDWFTVRNQLYWRDVVVLCSQATPQEAIDNLIAQQVDFIVAGGDRVDLRSALVRLRADYRVEKLRVDSGGILNGALLRAGLVDEIAVILNPCLTGGSSPRTLYIADDLPSRDGVIPLKLKTFEELRNGYLLLVYEIRKKV